MQNQSLSQTGLENQVPELRQVPKARVEPPPLWQLSLRDAASWGTASSSRRPQPTPTQRLCIAPD